MLNKYCIVLTTTNNKEIAELIAGALVVERLAACVQIDEVRSFFQWQGKTESEEEFRLMIKGRADNYKAIEQQILSMHNYKLPQIIKIDIADGLPAYLQWLGEEDQGKLPL